MSDSNYEEAFNSFLAGVLLTRNSISDFELAQLISEFENNYGVSIVGEPGDLNLNIENNHISLIGDYNDSIIINNYRITIGEYLNNIASDRVKEFFNLLPKSKTK